MTSGGKRKGAGSKPYPQDQLRKSFTVRLPQYLIKWFKCQPESNGVIIEKSITNQYNIKPD